MDRERIEYWSYGFENGNIIINFDNMTKYIEITPKDLKHMMTWILLEQKGLLE